MLINIGNFVIRLVCWFVGRILSVGIAYVAKWFEADKQGFAMGVFGAGNAGSAITKMIGPAIIAVGASTAASAAEGWRFLPKVYAGIMLITIHRFWFLVMIIKRIVLPVMLLLPVNWLF